MRVVTLKDIPEEPLGEATPIAGWTGGSVTRSRRRSSLTATHQTIAVAW